MNKPISNATGIYFKEIDNTVVTQSVGTFAGAIIGTTEKGPAFEIMPSSTFAERQTRMGGLNATTLSDGNTLKFPSCYYALNFLTQANNLKEVRVLGLEGYNELIGNNADEAADTDFPNGGKNKNGTDIAFPILYAVGASTPAQPQGGDPYESPAIAGIGSIAAILKPRRTSFTGANTIYTVNISGSLTDDSFMVNIQHTDIPNPTGNSVVSVECSLRPESKNYICNIFGTDPLDNTKLNGVPSPLWVDYVFPSEKTRNSMKPYRDGGGNPTYTRTVTANPGYELGYRYPGDIGDTASANTSLEIVGGDCIINSDFLGYPQQVIEGFLKTGSPYAPVITFTLPSHGYTAGQRVTLNGLPYGVLNKTWVIASNPAVDTNIFSINPTRLEYNQVLLSIGGSATPPDNSWKAKQKATSSWEGQVMNLGGEISPLTFRTPVTPWFVSDADVNGSVKRLFRIWSISDGHAANTEIKVEVSNINPAGNGGNGSFDILVRSFDDTEEVKVLREGYANLSLNSKSDSYIAARIGDGEAYPLKSRYIFIEMNQEDTLPSDVLPYGCEGYPNVDGMTLPDVQWTTEYNLTQPNAKQILGFANNSVNMQKKLAEDFLSFKNVPLVDSSNTGVGFHLNPNENNSLINSPYFEVAKSDKYVKSSTDSTGLGGTEKAKRNKFVVAFYGGFDGWNVYSERSWGDPLSLDYAAFQRGLEVLNDKESLDADFSVLVTPDINFEQHSSATREALDMVEGREDAIYLNDFMYDSTGVCNPDLAKLSLSGSNMLSNYCATYFPHWQIKDSVNKVNPWIAPSFIAYGTIASVATKENVWLPPAGSLRTMSDYLVRPRRRMKQGDRAILEGANINPITIFPGSGIEITDSKTTQEETSALSYIHNRMLLNYAKKVLNQTLRPLLQQLNSQALRDAFENTLFPIFDRIKKLNGLEDFKVTVTDVVEDRTVLYGTITITPLYPVRQISLTFQLSPAGVTFN